MSMMYPAEKYQPEIEQEPANDDWKIGRITRVDGKYYLSTCVMRMRESETVMGIQIVDMIDDESVMGIGADHELLERVWRSRFSGTPMPPAVDSAVAPRGNGPTLKRLRRDWQTMTQEVIYEGLVR